MLKKKLPSLRAAADDKVWEGSCASSFASCPRPYLLMHFSANQVDNSSRSDSPLVIKSAPAESDWRLEEGDKPSRALQVVRELHARQAHMWRSATSAVVVPAT